MKKNIRTRSSALRVFLSLGCALAVNAVMGSAAHALDHMPRDPGPANFEDDDTSYGAYRYPISGKYPELFQRIRNNRQQIVTITFEFQDQNQDMAKGRFY